MLQAAGLTLKPSKVQFGPNDMNICSSQHVITKSISVSTERIQAITRLPTPTCIEDLRSVLGMVHFVRRLVKGYVEITAALR